MPLQWGYKIWLGFKSLDLNIATNKRHGDSHLVAKSPFLKKATVYSATVTIATVANYTLPKLQHLVTFPFFNGG